MGFSRQEYWSGLTFPPPGDLPDPGIEPTSPVARALQADSLPLSHWGSPKKDIICIINMAPCIVRDQMHVEAQLERAATHELL